MTDIFMCSQEAWNCTAQNTGDRCISVVNLVGPSRHYFYCAFRMICAHGGINVVTHDAGFPCNTFGVYLLFCFQSEHVA